MPTPDFEGAWRYALQRLAAELPPALCYHCVAHTRDEVVVAAERLAVLEHLPPAERQLLLTAAHFHDIGYVQQRADHESAGVAIVEAVLPGFGFSAAQIDSVAGLLRATALPQRPSTLAEQILADADLDVLGGEHYWARSRDLRKEWEHFGVRVSDEEWRRGQAEFLQAHRYFTPSARRLREAAKQAHLARLLALLHTTAKPET